MKPQTRLLELDCLRGVAALMVVAFHFTMAQPQLTSIFKYGCTGVELFFLISGFVIFMSIERIGSYKDFIIARFSRLYPTYWVCVTISTSLVIGWSIIVGYSSKISLIDYLANLTMLQYYFGIKDIDTVYWTLILEMLFYVFILAIYLAGLTNRMEIIGFVFLLICLLYEFFLKLSAPSLFNFLKNYYPLINCMPLFIAGIVFYKIKFFKASAFKYLLLLLCLFTQVQLYNETYKGLFMSQLQYGLILLVFLLIFLFYSLNLLSFVINRPLLFCGKISYALYLIHYTIGNSMVIPLLTNSRHFHYAGWFIDLFVALPAVLLTAYFINKYIEQPAMRLFKNWRKSLNKVKII